MSAYKILIIGLGGFLGSVARYVTAKFVDEKLSPAFPYGTLTVNILGSFLLGIIYIIALRKAGLTENGRLFLGVGFCGGFTTFSAFCNEGFLLLKENQFSLFFIYFTASVVLGLLATAAGYFLTK